jgi:hypothetical protein
MHLGSVAFDLLRKATVWQEAYFKTMLFGQSPTVMHQRLIYSVPDSGKENGKALHGGHPLKRNRICSI